MRFWVWGYMEVNSPGYQVSAGCRGDLNCFSAIERELHGSQEGSMLVLKLVRKDVAFLGLGPSNIVHLGGRQNMLEQEVRENTQSMRN